MIDNQQQELIIDHLYMSFTRPDDGVPLKVLDNISFKAGGGEFISIVGPSGCGKTTLLNIIAGFEPVQEGRVLYNGQPVVKPSPERAMVFQSAVLFPWLTEHENVSNGLKRAGMKKSDYKSIVKDYLKMFRMQGFDDYYPEQLSGGMQQRVALARALVLQPAMLLMDEPFAALDAQTRLTMQELLLDLQQELSTTVILVTHDVEEALYLADRVYVMSKRPGRFIHDLTVPLKNLVIFPCAAKLHLPN